MFFIHSSQIFLVLVFDARKAHSLQPRRLSFLEEDFDQYTGELDNSICLVGYTANTWVSKENERIISFNLHWLAVLADDENVDGEKESDDE